MTRMEKSVEKVECIYFFFFSFAINLRYNYTILLFFLAAKKVGKLSGNDS